MTDLNDDVAEVLAVEREGSRWTVMLSLVGPYAAVFREEDDRSLALTTLPSLTPCEQTMLELLTRHGLT